MNNCRWCPESGDQQACGLHRQSPVDLKRDRAILNGINFKTCPDWHYMQTREDTCTFEDVKNSFSIERHALRLEIPQLPDGQIACVDQLGQRLYPRLDYSKGFPNWWWMQRIEIMAPSSHKQEGVQYAAEVILQHFYEIDHYKNQVRAVPRPSLHFWSDNFRFLIIYLSAWSYIHLFTRLSRGRIMGLS